MHESSGLHAPAQPRHAVWVRCGADDGLLPSSTFAQHPQKAALLWLDEARHDLVVSLRGVCGSARSFWMQLRLDVTPAAREPTQQARWRLKRGSDACPPRINRCSCTGKTDSQSACSSRRGNGDGGADMLASQLLLLTGRRLLHHRTGGPLLKRAVAAAHSQRAAVLGQDMRRWAAGAPAAWLPRLRPMQLRKGLVHVSARERGSSPQRGPLRRRRTTLRHAAERLGLACAAVVRR
jgi:hypothetical protein